MAGHFGFSESPEFPEFRLAGVPLEWLKGGAGTIRRSSFLARVNIRGEESFFGQEWNLGPPFGGSVSRPPKRKGGPPKRQTREETRRSRWDDDRYRSIFGWENGISTHPAWCGCGARPYLRSRCPLRAHTLGLSDAPPKVVTVAVVRRVATARRSHATLTPATRPRANTTVLFIAKGSRAQRGCPLWSRCARSSVGNAHRGYWIEAAGTSRRTKNQRLLRPVLRPVGYGKKFLFPPEYLTWTLGTRMTWIYLGFQMKQTGVWMEGKINEGELNARVVFYFAT